MHTHVHTHTLLHRSRFSDTFADDQKMISQKERDSASRYDIRDMTTNPKQSSSNDYVFNTMKVNTGKPVVLNHTHTTTVQPN